MSTWYYYNESGKKIAVTGGRLKGLAKTGLITPDTIVENAEGKSAPARKVKGLTFVAITQPEPTQETELPLPNEVYVAPSDTAEIYGLAQSPKLVPEASPFTAPISGINRTSNEDLYKTFDQPDDEPATALEPAQETESPLSNGANIASSDTAEMYGLVQSPKLVPETSPFTAPISGINRAFNEDLYKTFDQPDDELVAALEPGTLLANRYRLLQQIGRGGMGVVWSAEEKLADRKVVLKFVPHDLKNFETAVAQLKESFKKIHELQHQYICPIYTLEEDDYRGYYLVMKWLDGETLDQYIVRTAGRGQPLPLEMVLRILHPVAEALDYAHSQKIIHRDVKPSNIFIVLDDKKAIRDVQIIDFGLASEIRSSLTRISQIRFDTSGTRPYMAPEQWRARPQSAATDQYALAVTAYELLAGHLPFDFDDDEMFRIAVMQDMPEVIRDVPKHVNAALLKALAKDDGKRFKTCAEFLAALGGTKFAVVKKTQMMPQQKRPKSVEYHETEEVARWHKVLEAFDPTTGRNSDVVKIGEGMGFFFGIIFYASTFGGINILIALPIYLFTAWIGYKVLESLDPTMGRSSEVVKIGGWGGGLLLGIIFYASMFGGVNIIISLPICLFTAWIGSVIAKIIFTWRR